MSTLKSTLGFYVRVMKWAKRYPNKEVSRVRLTKDYLHLYETKGLSMDEYECFEFEKQPEAFRKDFLGLNEQRHYLDCLNPIKYYSFARNKYVAHKMFENTGIRTSTLFCYYDPWSRINGSSEIASSAADVVRILKSKNVENCVIKATEDSHGDNVIVVKSIEYTADDCRLTLYNGEEALLSQTLQQSPRIFESVIAQTDQMASFNASSVNTIRFMTRLMPDGTADVFATFIKIGRAGSCVDNAGAGGNVDVAVDVETGEIRYAIQFDGWRKIKEIEKHPDSGAQLNGTVIDNWDRIKAEVCRFQQAFPWCKAAGWDIAITDEGPLVIEVNDLWDRTGQLFIRKGWRREIRDCYMAWQGSDYDSTLYRLKNKLDRQTLLKIVRRN